jgi:hypothetical protein
MPTLTTQSIGIGAAPLAGTQSATQVRANEAATQAGMQRVQTQARALNSATQALSTTPRSVQQQKRAEGPSTDAEEREESKDQSQGNMRPGSTFSKVV